ncbi:MAG: hypothetical protein JSW47_00110, partial [Phycisphaerales bacterium]
MEKLGVTPKLFGSPRIVVLVLLFLTTTAATGAPTAQKKIPRPEHPKPQFYRDTWLNLNGQWNFAFDFDVIGV